MAQALCKQRLPNEGTGKSCWDVWVKPFQTASAPRDDVWATGKRSGKPAVQATPA